MEWNVGVMLWRIGDVLDIDAQMDWVLGYCKENADSEIWARTVQHWDKHISETPTFWFLDEEIMSKARSQKIEDED